MVRCPSLVIPSEAAPAPHLQWEIPEAPQPVCELRAEGALVRVRRGTRYGSPQERGETLEHPIADLAEGRHAVVIRAGGLGRSRKTEVNPAADPQPQRALLRRRVADRHHQVEWDVAHLVDGLRASEMLDADLGQGADGQGMDVTRRVRAGGLRLPLATLARVDDGFGHLRAGGGSSAQEEDTARFHIG